MIYIAIYQNQNVPVINLIDSLIALKACCKKLKLIQVNFRIPVFTVTV